MSWFKTIKLIRLNCRYDINPILSGRKTPEIEMKRSVRGTTLLELLSQLAAALQSGALIGFILADTDPLKHAWISPDTDPSPPGGLLANQGCTGW